MRIVYKPDKRGYLVEYDNGLRIFIPDILILNSCKSANQLATEGWGRWIDKYYNFIHKRFLRVL